MTRNTKQCQADMKYASNGIIRNYENLMITIISTAASDYRNTRKRQAELQKNLVRYGYSSEKRDKIYDSLRDCRREIYKLEKFFRASEWFGFLDLDGKYILTNLQEEFNDK